MRESLSWFHTPTLTIAEYLVGIQIKSTLEPGTIKCVPNPGICVTFGEHGADGNIQISVTNSKTSTIGHGAIRPQYVSSPQQWGMALQKDNLLKTMIATVLPGDLSDFIASEGYSNKDCLSNSWLDTESWDGYTDQLLFAYSAAQFIMDTITANFDDDFRRTTKSKHPVWLNTHAKLTIEHRVDKQKIIIISSETASKRGVNLRFHMGDAPMNEWFLKIANNILFEKSLLFGGSMLDTLTVNILFMGTNRQDAEKLQLELIHRFMALGNSVLHPAWVYNSLTLNDAAYALLCECGIDAFTMFDDDGRMRIVHPSVIAKHPPIYDRYSFPQAIRLASEFSTKQDRI